MITGSAPYQLAIDAFRQRRIAAAIDLLHRAERQGCDPDECAALRWRCWMLSGDFERAWQESDRIAARGLPDPHRFWNGQPFNGKRVIIRCLHGFGDAIQFIRYASLVRRQAANVTVQTHPELVSLFRVVQGVDDVITWSGEEAVEWDQQIEVMELPRIFRTTLATIPCEIPYLTIDEDARKHSRIPPPDGGPWRIGLQWAAGDWNPQRSIPLAQMRPLCQVPDVEYYSFQRGTPRLELREFAASNPIHDVSGDCPEIQAAAADLLNIDVLITADTMLAHLAGALGKQVWMLLCWDADWRWMLERQDTPWYPTMRLFRQPVSGDWDTPIRQMCIELAARFSFGMTLARG